MEFIMTLTIAVGLSATSGFRVFVPFLLASLASLAGHLELAPAFAWIGTYPALAVFGMAALLEILAYFVPLVDNLLATLSAPAALVAGILVSASVLGEMSPLLTWSLAIIAGGGASLVGKATSNMLHLGTTAFSGGTANPLLSLVESILSLLLAGLAVFFPLLALALFILIFYGGIKRYRRHTQKYPGV